MSNNFLSDEAIGEIRRFMIKVRELEARVSNMPSMRVPYHPHTLAEIDANEGAGVYSATEVISGTDGVAGTLAPDPLTWGDGTDDVGYLRSVRYARDDASGIVSAYPYTDGTSIFWGFDYFQEGTDYDFVGSVSGTSLYIFGGTVTIGNTTATVLPLSSQSITTVQDYWVEVTATISPSTYLFTYSINTTIQFGAIGSTETEDASGNKTIKFRVGTSDGTSWNQEQVGAILHPDLSPGTKAALDEISRTDFVGSLDVSDPAAGVGLLLGNSELTHVRGLADEFTTADSGDGTVFIEPSDWVGFLDSANGVQVVHERPAITGPSDNRHWDTITHDGTTYSNDSGITGTTIEWFLDVKGHPYDITIDGTSIPDPSDAYLNNLYQHCSNPLVYPSIIFDDASNPATNYVEVNGQCYAFQGSTEQAAGNPTVTATYASCAACESAAVNELVKKCSDDSSAYVLGPSTHSGSDYFYADDEKCYIDMATSATVNEPACILDMASTTVPAAVRTTPTSCAELKIDAYSDNFSDGTINTCKWQSTLDLGSGGSASIVSGELSIVTVSPGNNYHYRYFDILNHSGAWTVKVKWTDDGTAYDGQNYGLMIAETTNNLHAVSWQNQETTSNRWQATPSTTNVTGESAFGEYIISSDGSTVTRQGINDLGQTINLGTVADTGNLKGMYLGARSTENEPTSWLYDDAIITDDN